MGALIVIAVVVTSGFFVHWMYKTDKARRDRNKAFEEAAKREKQRRMRGFDGTDFWNDPDKDQGDKK